MGNKHLIGKQVLLMEMQTQHGAFALQQQFSETYRRAIVPAMERLFDRLVGPEMYIRLDKVEIDLGALNASQLSSDRLAQIIADQLEAIILEQLQLPASATNTARPIHSFDQWLHWLEHGVLPIYHTVPEPNWLEAVLQTLGLEMNAVLRLQNLLNKSSIALQRLVLQHDRTFLKSLLELFTGQPQGPLLNFLDSLPKALALVSVPFGQIEWRSTEVEFWTALVQAAVIKRAKLPAMELIILASERPILKENLLKLGKIAQKDKALALNPILKAMIQNMAQMDAGEQRLSEDKLETVEEQAQDTEVGQAAPAVTFIQNAGIVLLHPYIVPLFRNLELLEGISFKDEASRHKAVLLLHYLATGETNTPDYQLVLPKFLCDMPVNIPLDHTLSLEETAQTEADNLLAAAIQNWNALGNASPDALREGFLQRAGKLESSQGSWRLGLEKHTLDILLDRLPWGIGIVKLPWMAEMLRVEWR